MSREKCTKEHWSGKTKEWNERESVWIKLVFGWIASEWSSWHIFNPKIVDRNTIIVILNYYTLFLLFFCSFSLFILSFVIMSTGRQHSTKIMWHQRESRSVTRKQISKNDFIFSIYLYMKKRAYSSISIYIKIDMNSCQ